MMLQMIVAFMLMQNVSSFTPEQSQTLESIDKVQTAVKVVKMLHGFK